MVHDNLAVLTVNWDILQFLYKCGLKCFSLFEISNITQLQILKSSNIIEHFAKQMLQLKIKYIFYKNIIGVISIHKVIFKHIGFIDYDSYKKKHLYCGVLNMELIKIK